MPYIHEKNFGAEITALEIRHFNWFIIQHVCRFFQSKSCMKARFSVRGLERAGAGWLSMADSQLYHKPRGNYKKYLRHSNPFKFSAARLATKRHLKKGNCLTLTSREIFDCDSGRIDEILRDELSSPSQSDVYNEVCYEYPINDVEINQEFPSCNSNGKALEATGFDTSLSTSSETIYQCSIEEENGDDTSSTSSETNYLCSIEEENSDSDADSDTETTQDQVNDDPPLYSGSPLCTSSSLLLILSFVQKHALTGKAFADLLTVIEAHCPKPNNCTTTVKKLLDVLGHSKGDIVHHTYCTYCKGYVGKSDDSCTTRGTCRICGKDLVEFQGKFIEVPLVSQLQKFFNGKSKSFCTSNLPMPEQGI